MWPVVGSVTTKASANATDALALLAFKHQLRSDSLSTSNDSLPFCHLSPFIANLTFLREIDLSRNKLHGQIPPEIWRLLRLRHLYLYENSLGGEIPVNLTRCWRLTAISFDTNELIGRIPVELGSLSRLSMLSLFRNSLTGSIPTSLGNLSSLTYFSVWGNELEGNIPDLEVTLPNLIMFFGGGNRFTGPIPISLSNASRLERLGLSKNRFTGSIPTNLGRLQRLSDLANLIGVGSYGFVYKGYLDHIMKTVAVNVLNLQRQGASKSFIVEYKALRNIRHQNLLKVFTVCSSIDFKGDEFKALVFDYMANGNLEQWLHPSMDEQHQPKNLSLIQRLEPFGSLFRREGDRGVRRNYEVTKMIMTLIATMALEMPKRGGDYDDEVKGVKISPDPVVRGKPATFSISASSGKFMLPRTHQMSKYPMENPLRGDVEKSSIQISRISLKLWAPLENDLG
ncbi:hypothetical protein MRB53_022540 [Persea americana]|uniref:Uncharacterized protein n=1 Tax=Persea americana TaxID=3435 RepID=A0ACC2L6X4_PERAE|nr:hypothetical protein MRB53_022540 [Persea americana]